MIITTSEFISVSSIYQRITSTDIAPADIEGRFSEKETEVGMTASQSIL